MKSIIYIILLLGWLQASAYDRTCNAPLFTFVDAVTSTSLQLNWNDFNEEVIGWEIEYDVKGFIDTGLPTTELITEKKYTLSGLLPGTAYDVYIRAICSESETSGWNGPFSVRTAIDNNESCNVSLDIKDNGCPRLESFLISVTSFPDMRLGRDIFIQSIDMVIEHDWPADLQLYLKSPSGNRILLAKNEGAGLDNYGSPSDETCNTVASFSDLACTLVEENNTNSELIGSFLPAEGFETLYDDTEVNGLWAIEACDRAFQDRGTIKYIKINFSEIICDVPIKIAATEISATSARVVWDPPGNCSIAVINIVNSGDPPGSNIEIFSSCQLGEFLVTGLLPDTPYDIYIQSDCVSTLSAFSCPASFTTACSEVSIASSFDRSTLCQASCNTMCNIEDPIWHNISEDTQDWIVFSGQSLTELTGPATDVSGIGNYVYIENTSEICGPRNKVILETSCLHVPEGQGGCSMSFYYHMYGDDIDSLLLSISSDGWVTEEVLFTQVGNQGNQWTRSFIDLSTYQGQLVSLRFIGFSGVDNRGDIALDQIEFYGIENIPSLPVFYLDSDGDGYGTVDSILTVCLLENPAGYSTIMGDCNDENELVNPGVSEIQCNSIDDNCNGIQDDAEETNPIHITLEELRNESCVGESDGSITLSVNGGTPPYSVLWNNGATGLTINNISDGVYFAEVSDAGSCKSRTMFFDIDVENQPEIFLIGTNSTPCNESLGNIDIEVAGGSQPYTYTWSNGMQSQDLENIPEGVYSVIVTDFNGCSVERNNIEIISAPRFTAGIQFNRENICHGGSTGAAGVSVINAIEPVTYLWSNGMTTPAVSNLAAGEYSVEINDARGCREVIFLEIGEPDSLVIEVTSLEQITCDQGSDGSIQTTTHGGTPPYNFRWSHGAISDDLFSLQEGSYHLQVTDINGCVASSPVLQIEAPPPIEVDIDSIQHVKCKLSNNGYISVAASGGAGEYNYFWGNQRGSTPELTNLTEGTYSLTIIDQFGCKLTRNDFKIENSETPLPLSSSITQDNTCSYDSLGQVSVVVGEGKLPLDYNWSNGKQVVVNRFSDTISNLPGGNYNVTVTDGDGCIGETTALSISTIEPITIDNISINNNNCNSDLDGSINLEIIGSHPPYRFLWNTGETEAGIVDKPSGKYTVTITDSENCLIESDTIEIGIDNPIFIVPEIIPSGDGDDGSIKIEISGGVRPYTIEWDNGETNVTEIPNLGKGTYCVKITDSNKCVAEDCYRVASTTSIQTHNKDTFSFYPNPTSHTIKWETSEKVLNISIYDVTGRLMLKLEHPESEIILPTEINGVYFIQVETPQGRSYYKAIKLN